MIGIPHPRLPCQLYARWCIQCFDFLLAAMSQVDEVATQQQAVIQEFNKKKEELSDAQEDLRAAKTAFDSASPEEKARCEQEVYEARDEVFRLRWEVAKAELKAARTTGQTGELDDLQKAVDVYMLAYQKRIAGQQVILTFLMYVCIIALVCTFLLSV
jgi:uncharacterized protein (DUF3084 family)